MPIPPAASVAVASVPAASVLRACAVATLTLLLTATATVTATTSSAQVGSAALTRDERRAPLQAAPPSYAIVTDGDVTDLARRGDTIFVRGDFTRIGRFTGSGLPLDPATGARTEAPALDGQVSVVVADGDGGWFVGGNTASVDGHRFGGVLHVAADGTADPAFAPRVRGLVSALALDGETLFVGGLFDSVDDSERRNLAAIDTTTGDVTPFLAPRPDRVTELVVTDDRLYVGDGSLIAVDPTTGARDESFVAALPGEVRALAAEPDGTRLYVGGRGLVALDPDTGDADPTFAPTATPYGQLGGVVHTILPSGGRLFVGGGFGSLGETPGPLVSLDPATGTGDPAFAPAVTDLGDGPDRGVFDLGMVGDELWVGGLFGSVGAAPATNLAAVDASTGARASKALDHLDGQVNAVEPSGTGLYVGGQFFMAGSVRASGTAALDANTLLPRAGFRGHHVLRFGSMVPGRRAVYVARTNFHGYDRFEHDAGGRWYSPTRLDVRAFDPATGEPIDRLAVTGVQNLSGVTTLGDRLYVAQRLDNRVRFPRNQITAYSQRTGERLSSFVLPLKGYVTELGTAGNDLLVAGSFRRTRPGGQPAHLALLRVRPGNGHVRNGFDPQTNGPIYDISRQGDDVYAAGIYRTAGYGNAFKPGLARFTLDREWPGTLDLRDTFRPPSHRLSHDGTVVALGGVVMTNGWTNRFLDAVSGEPVEDPLDGYGRQTSLALPYGESLVYLGELYLPLAADDYYALSFISRTGG
ncbi:hypothetical protein NPS01_27410 [Nocardioides psychrotolerans]|uniref:Delta-60 repeat domain-containing protein n=1 Tax=Nocardioides psychrotolerans TaxID=1005945 RepID=A0A1I3N085_9ACTN|nr:PQQ-binding-like beta-propeller repeat protein [Nocardioides psychrotolerans]GEP39078.1 hypothetical protein NPS01_27410 [Nocardioides psychrotolerans]SFJ02627.1 hypothetical protein SAMN05216561_11695 [Nocardioides psychrotolerans]